MPTVYPVPFGSLGSNFTSIRPSAGVPSGAITRMVLVILRALIIPHAHGVAKHRPGRSRERAARQHEVGSQHEIQLGPHVDAVRIEPVERRFGRHSPNRGGPEVVADEVQAAIEFGDTAGRFPVAEPICVIRKPPSGRGKKSSVMLESSAFVDIRKRGWRAFGDIEEEDSVLALQQAQQPAASQKPLVRRKMAMVRLIADISRRWKRHGGDDASVGPGILVEVNDGQKIGRDVSLIARPDIEHGLLLRTTRVLGEAGASRGEQ